MHRSGQELPVVVRFFDELPDAALVDVRTIALVEGVCVQTVWRRVRDGTFPKPQPRLPGSNTTRWTVGSVRADRARREIA
jgi:predicted DNA-binding transcriptional regulator AlpA